MRYLTSGLLVLLCVDLGAGDAWAESASVTLAQNGQAQMPIVVAPDATETVHEHVQTLAEYLDKITGGAFEVVEGDGAEGIAIGLSGDFSAAFKITGPPVDPSAPEQRERYWLRSHPTGLHVVGNTELAVQNAVWDLLHRLGYRQYFTGDAWEIVPDEPTIQLAIDVDERPDYLHRFLWWGYGFGDYNEEPYNRWAARNRMVSGFELNTGHVYDTIVARFKPEFIEHPEYLSFYQGKRHTVDDVFSNVSYKLCISNPRVRELAVEYALEFFEQHPEADSVSMDPSDGGGWCECGPCLEIGSPSDRVVLLANTVAEAIVEPFPDKYVGIYAYGFHSPPPSIDVHPKVIVNVATVFLRGGWTLPQLFEKWGQRGVRQFGVREYYAVMPWDHDLPGQAYGGNIDYLTTTIPDFYNKSARFITMEASDNWGPNGLGYYLSSRLMWDVDAAERTDEIINDFLDRAFGPAREPMAGFYDLLDGSVTRPLSPDLVGRMYGTLSEASELASADPDIQARIDELILYTRYVELYMVYTTASDDVVQDAWEAVLRHSYRIRKTMMTHVVGFARDQPHRDKRIRIPDEAQWNVPADQNPWMSDEPFSRVELDEMVARGIANNPLLDFEAVGFSGHPKPVDLLRGDNIFGRFGSAGRNTEEYLLWLDENQPFDMQVTTGMIDSYREMDLGDTTIELETVGRPVDETVGQAALPRDGETHTVTLRAKDAGLYRLTVNDNGDMTGVVLPDDLVVTREASSQNKLLIYNPATLYFYVPHGVTKVGGHTTGKGTITPGESTDGNFYQDAVEDGYFSIPVPDGTTGRCWRIDVTSSYGEWTLLTVPPYVARSPDQLMLPESVKLPER